MTSDSSRTVEAFAVVVAVIGITITSVITHRVDAQGFDTLTRINDSKNRMALIGEVNQTSRHLFDDPIESRDHQFDASRMLEILQSHYPGVFDKFSILHSYNWLTEKSHIEMQGNGLGLVEAGGNKKQIDDISRLFGFHVIGYSQFSSGELIMILETDGQLQ